MQQQVIPINKTFLDIPRKKAQENIIAKVAKGLIDPTNLRNEQLKELQTELIEQGLDIKQIVSKYKDAILAKGVEYKGSDVLKALDSVREMWQLKDSGDSQLQIRAMTQTKTATEIKTTLIEVTGRTQEYLKKLQELDDE